MLIFPLVCLMFFSPVFTEQILDHDESTPITISFANSNGIVLTKSIPIQWNLDTIHFSEDNYLSDKTALIQVVDPDLNLNPEYLDHISIKVYSDSDLAGINVDAIETSDRSGIFVATITFTQNQSSGGNRLFVIPGDTVFATYDDHTLPKPYSRFDNLKIITHVKIDSTIPPLEKLQNSPIVLSNAYNQLKSSLANQEMQIIGKITNEQNFKQKFIYIIQIKDENNFVTSIFWIQGEISENQNFNVSQSWTPITSGTYTIESYIWNSLIDSTPLSPSMLTSIFVK